MARLEAPVDGLCAHVLDLLRPLGPVQARRLFGGTGFYLQDTQFGMVVDGQMYFVVDDAARPGYEAAGSQPFSYRTRKGVVQVRRYMQVPADCLEEPPRFAALARDALRVALATARPKRRLS